MAVPYHRHARVAGTSKFSLWRLWNFALEGITGFSTVPLRAATYLGWQPRRWPSCSACG
jgi:hypothetical protein